MIKRIKHILDWIREWKFGILLFLNSCFFLYLFLADISARLDLGSREIVGDVSFKYNTIQRKFEQEQIWDEVDTNSPISNRDSVRTEKRSQAILLLKDGTEIQMDEESMVIVEITPKTQRIQFQSGSINIKKNPVKDSYFKSVVVESSSGTVTVNDGDVIVAKNTPKSLDVGVARGEAVVQVDGKTLELKKNQRIIHDSGEIQAKEQVVKLEDPRDKALRLERLKKNALQPVVSETTGQFVTREPEKKSAPASQDTKISTENKPGNTENKPLAESPKDPQPRKTEAPKQPYSNPTDEIRRQKEKEAMERFLKM
jgi:hypothetical protein